MTCSPPRAPPCPPAGTGEWEWWVGDLRSEQRARPLACALHTKEKGIEGSDVGSRQSLTTLTLRSSFSERVCPVRWKSGSIHASLLSRLTPSRVATLKFIGRRARDRVHPRARPRPEDTSKTRRRPPPACTSSTATAPCRPRERIQSEGKTHTKALTASSNPTTPRRHAGAPAASKRPRRGSTGGIPKAASSPELPAESVHIMACKTNLVSDMRLAMS